MENNKLFNHSITTSHTAAATVITPCMHVVLPHMDQCHRQCAVREIESHFFYYSFFHFSIMKLRSNASGAAAPLLPMQFYAEKSLTVNDIIFSSFFEISLEQTNPKVMQENPKQMQPLVAKEKYGNRNNVILVIVGREIDIYIYVALF